MTELTLKQRRVLTCITDTIAATGQPPTVREIGSALGVASSCTVQRHLEALVRKGALEQRKRYGYRGYWPTGSEAPPPYEELVARLKLAEDALRYIHTLCGTESEREFHHALKVSIPAVVEELIPELRPAAALRRAA